MQNFTDVDDKIINRANEEGITAPESCRRRYIGEYFQRCGGSERARRPTVHPRVTEHIQDIIDFVQTLVDKGYAYEADGDVYFSHEKVP